MFQKFYHVLQPFVITVNFNVSCYFQTFKLNELKLIQVGCLEFQVNKILLRARKIIRSECYRSRCDACHVSRSSHPSSAV